MKVLGKIFASVIGFTGTLFLLHNMWAWFIVPLGMPQISYAHAYGINLLITHITFQVDAYSFKNKLTETEKDTKTVTLMILPWIILLFGWITNLFM